jgi:hypothetical protein
VALGVRYDWVSKVRSDYFTASSSNAPRLTHSARTLPLCIQCTRFSRDACCTLCATDRHGHGGRRRVCAPPRLTQSHSAHGRTLSTPFVRAHRVHALSTPFVHSSHCVAAALWVCGTTGLRSYRRSRRRLLGCGSRAGRTPAATARLTVARPTQCLRTCVPAWKLHPCLGAWELHSCTLLTVMMSCVRCGWSRSIGMRSCRAPWRRPTLGSYLATDHSITQCLHSGVWTLPCTPPVPRITASHGACTLPCTLPCSEHSVCAQSTVCVLRAQCVCTLTRRCTVCSMRVVQVPEATCEWAYEMAANVRRADPHVARVCPTLNERVLVEWVRHKGGVPVHNMHGSERVSAACALRRKCGLQIGESSTPYWCSRALPG